MSTMEQRAALSKLTHDVWSKQFEHDAAEDASNLVYLAKTDEQSLKHARDAFYEAQDFYSRHHIYLFDEQQQTQILTALDVLREAVGLAPEPVTAG